MSGAGHVSRRLSWRGWGLLLVGLALVAAAPLLHERDLVAVGGFALALPLLAMAWVGARRARVATRVRISPPAVAIGERGLVRLEISNAGRYRWSAPEVHVPRVPGLLAQSRTLEGPVAPGGAVELAVGFVAARRGRYRVPAPTVSFGDPFGLWREEHSSTGAVEVLVPPDVVDLAGLPPGVGARTARAAAAGDGQGGTVGVGVRPYVAGDDIRTIHWRASARLEDDLVVRVRESSGVRSVAVVLDDRPSAHAGSRGLETAVALAASIGRHLLAANLSVTLSDGAGHLVAAGESSGESTAERLQVALAGAGESDGPLRPRVPGRPDVLIAVVGVLTAAAAAELARVALPGVPGLAFAVAAGSGALVGPPGWQVVVVAPGAETAGGRGLQEAWRQACAGVGRR